MKDVPVIEINLKSIEQRIESARDELDRRKGIRLEARRDLEDELMGFSEYKTLTEDINDQMGERTKIKKSLVKSRKDVAVKNDAAKEAHKEVEKQRKVLSDLLAEYYATHARSLEVDLGGGRKLLIVNQMKLF